MNIFQKSTLNDLILLDILFNEYFAIIFLIFRITVLVSFVLILSIKFKRLANSPPTFD